jgi:hypothetical protein
MFDRRSYVRKLAKADDKFIKINKIKFQDRFYMG